METHEDEMGRFGLLVLIELARWVEDKGCEISALQIKGDLDLSHQWRRA